MRARLELFAPFRILFSAARLCGFVFLVLALSGCGYYINANNGGSGQKLPVASQSGSVAISPQYAALNPGQRLQFTASNGGGSLQWLVNGVPGGNPVVGTISQSGMYSAPASPPQSLNVTVTAQLTGSAQTNTATSVVSVIGLAKITTTANPQVAMYSIDLPEPGSAYVEFGPTESYGLPTWTQSAPQPSGGPINFYVAGMRGNASYHMRARISLADGATLIEPDQTFATGNAPQTSPVVISTGGGAGPQPGIELFDTVLPYEPGQAFATDLQGNVIWTYSYKGSKSDVIQPIKLLPNGDFLLVISYTSSISIKGSGPPFGALDEVREVDLAGNTIRSITQVSLASALTAEGYTFTLGSFHHDVLALPNGHWVILATVSKSFTDLPGYPGTTNVLGDVLIDVDQNSKPDWVWNAFDHLDVNRHPYLFPDWTHSNSLLYSTDDHNLLLSMRHQNWVLKIDFNDGQGSGDVLWRLGEGGDFKLLNGVDPTDWFYAQHGMSYFTPNTTGVFELGLMDNGDDRQFPPGAPCPVAATPCLYSTVPVLRIDEAAMTATLVFHDIAPPSLYNAFGGDVNLLANGDLEADFCAVRSGSVIQEMSMSGTPPHQVWSAVTPSYYQYRADRLPSLYPGVQW